MIKRLFPLAQNLLGALDPETAHGLALKALALAPRAKIRPDDPRLAVEILGRRFPNPVGLAPGFDKQAEVPDALLALGFGFVELGGVVPEPQGGNARPRLFRLARDGAVINRMGLNSEGIDTISSRLRARLGRPGIVGVNIGPNKNSADRVADYLRSIRALHGLVDFLTVNVSSPNTPGLRDLQGEAFLDDLLARAVEARHRAAEGGERAGQGTRMAILVKIAPDLDLAALDGLVATARRRGVDGLVVANTTIARPLLAEATLAAEAGGLSGRPLFAPSTRLLAETFLRVDGAMPLIGVGGIDSAETAWTKIRAGADLVELYTGLVFRGPALIDEIKSGLLWRIEVQKIGSLKALVGRDAEAIASGELLV